MEKNNEVRFHLSLPCENMAETIAFYANELGCEIGRKSHNWADVNFFNNQITFYQKPGASINCGNYMLDRHALPVFHLGVILELADWNRQLEKYRSKDYLVIEPTLFLANKKGEHNSFFVKDPNDYKLEFKLFTDSSQIFLK